MIPALSTELKRRHLKEPSICPMCGHEKDGLYHALITCDHAKQSWSEAQKKFEFKLPKLHPNTFFCGKKKEILLTYRNVTIVGYTVLPEVLPRWARLWLAPFWLLSTLLTKTSLSPILYLMLVTRCTRADLSFFFVLIIAIVVE
jgi:hypothetical protein